MMFNNSFIHSLVCNIVFFNGFSSVFQLVFKHLRIFSVEVLQDLKLQCNFLTICLPV